MAIAGYECILGNTCPYPPLESDMGALFEASRYFIFTQLHYYISVPGVDVFYKNRDGRTFIHVLLVTATMQRKLHESTWNQLLTFLEIVVSRHPTISLIADKNEVTPLHLSIGWLQNKKATRILLSSVSELLTLDDYEKYINLSIATNNSLLVASFYSIANSYHPIFYQHQGDKEEKKMFSNILSFAVKNQCDKALLILCQSEVYRIHLKSSLFILMTQTDINKQNIASILLKYGAIPTYPYQTILSCDKKQFCLDYHCFIDNAISHASWLGRNDVLEILIFDSSSFQFSSHNTKCHTKLGSWGSFYCGNYLLKSSPLVLAVLSSSIPCLELLLHHPHFTSIKNLQDYSGWSPLSLACAMSNVSVVQILLDAGLDPLHPNHLESHHLYAEMGERTNDQQQEQQQDKVNKIVNMVKYWKSNIEKLNKLMGNTKINTSKTVSDGHTPIALWLQRQSLIRGCIQKAKDKLQNIVKEELNTLAATATSLTITHKQFFDILISIIYDLKLESHGNESRMSLEDSLTRPRQVIDDMVSILDHLAEISKTCHTIDTFVQELTSRESLLRLRRSLREILILSDKISNNKKFGSIFTSLIISCNSINTTLQTITMIHFDLLSNLGELSETIRISHKLLSESLFQFLQVPRSVTPFAYCSIRYPKYCSYFNQKKVFNSVIILKLLEDMTKLQSYNTTTNLVISLAKYISKTSMFSYIWLDAAVDRDFQLVNYFTMKAVEWDTCQNLTCLAEILCREGQIDILANLSRYGMVLHTSVDIAVKACIQQLDPMALITLLLSGSWGLLSSIGYLQQERTAVTNTTRGAYWAEALSGVVARNVFAGLSFHHIGGRQFSDRPTSSSSQRTVGAASADSSLSSFANALSLTNRKALLQEILGLLRDMSNNDYASSPTPSLKNSIHLRTVDFNHTAYLCVSFTGDEPRDLLLPLAQRNVPGGVLCSITSKLNSPSVLGMLGVHGRLIRYNHTGSSRVTLNRTSSTKEMARHLELVFLFVPTVPCSMVTRLWHPFLRRLAASGSGAAMKSVLAVLTATGLSCCGNVIFSDGETSLTVAARAGNCEVIRVLMGAISKCIKKGTRTNDPIPSCCCGLSCLQSIDKSSKQVSRSRIVPSNGGGFGILVDVTRTCQNLRVDITKRRNESELKMKSLGRIDPRGDGLFTALLSLMRLTVEIADSVDVNLQLLSHDKVEGSSGLVPAECCNSDILHSKGQLAVLLTICDISGTDGFKDFASKLQQAPLSMSDSILGRLSAHELFSPLSTGDSLASERQKMINSSDNPLYRWLDLWILLLSVPGHGLTLRAWIAKLRETGLLIDNDRCEHLETPFDWTGSADNILSQVSSCQMESRLLLDLQLRVDRNMNAYDVYQRRREDSVAKEDSTGAIWLPAHVLPLVTVDGIQVKALLLSDVTDDELRYQTDDAATGVANVTTVALRLAMDILAASETADTAFYCDKSHLYTMTGAEVIASLMTSLTTDLRQQFASKKSQLINDLLSILRTQLQSLSQMFPTLYGSLSQYEVLDVYPFSEDEFIWYRIYVVLQGWILSSIGLLVDSQTGDFDFDHVIYYKLYQSAFQAWCLPPLYGIEASGSLRMGRSLPHACDDYGKSSRWMCSVLHAAVRSGNAKSVAAVVDGWKTDDAIDSPSNADAENVFCTVAATGNWPIWQLLLENSFQCVSNNLCSTNERPWSPLLAAVTGCERDERDDVLEQMDHLPYEPLRIGGLGKGAYGKSHFER